MPAAVCIVIDTNQVGGPGKGIIQYLRHTPLKHLRHIVVTPRYPNRPEAPFARAVIEAGFELHFVDQRHGFDTQALSQMVELVRAQNCAIIQTHGYKAHLFGWWTRRKLKIPWIAYAHGWTSENLKVRLYNQVERILLPRADHVVAVSRPLYERALKWRGETQSRASSTSLIMNAVDAAEVRRTSSAAQIREQLGLSSSKLLLGFIGRLSSEKGLEFLLQAFSQAIAKGMQAHLMLVGKGPELSNLRALTQRLGLEQFVSFCGHQESLAGYYEALDILILPSISEGLPNVVLEAMVFEKPVIATRVGSVPDVITHQVDGLLVPAGDAVALAQALYELSQSAEKRSQIGSLAAQTARSRFGAAARAQAIAEIYTKLLKNIAKK